MAPTDKKQNGSDRDERIPYDEAEAIDASPPPTPEQAETRAVTAWRPEDAADFLAKAIRESQRPFEKALARPSVPAGTVWLIVLILLVFAGGIYYRLHLKDQELQDLRPMAMTAGGAEDRARRSEEEAAGLRDRLDRSEREARRADEQLERTREDLQKTRAELADLEKKLEASQVDREERERLLLRVDEAETTLKRVRDELERARKTVRILEEQVRAQETTNQALRRELDVAKARIRDLSDGPAAPDAEDAGPADDAAAPEDANDAPEDNGGEAMRMRTGADTPARADAA
jgi:hypothetical protein